MNIIELSNWEWVASVCLLMLLVWLSVLFQARQSAHEVQSTKAADHGSDDNPHSSENVSANEVEEG